MDDILAACRMTQQDHFLMSSVSVRTLTERAKLLPSDRRCLTKASISSRSRSREPVPKPSYAEFQCICTLTSSVQAIFPEGHSQKDAHSFHPMFCSSSDSFGQKGTSPRPFVSPPMKMTALREARSPDEK